MRLRTGPKFRHVTDAANSAASPCCSAAPRASARSRSCRATPCLRRCSSAASMPHAFDPREQTARELVTRKFDRVFIALHGPGGEDGTLQGALEFLGLPYTGSGVMGSAIGMDKLRTKRLAQAVGIPPPTTWCCARPPTSTTRGRAPRAADDREARDAGLVRRHDQGRESRSVARRPIRPRRCSSPMCSPSAWITGAEYTVAILQGRALPSIRIETPARSTTTRRSTSVTRSTSARRVCPPRPRASREPRARHVHRRGRRGLGPRRLHDGQGGPGATAGDQHGAGMTDHSLVPMAARALDISFEQLVWQVLASHPSWMDGLTFASGRMTAERGPVPFLSFQNARPAVRRAAGGRQERERPPRHAAAGLRDRPAATSSGWSRPAERRRLGRRRRAQAEPGLGRERDGDHQGFNQRNHEGVVDDDVYFARFHGMTYAPVKDDALSATLPAIPQEIRAFAVGGLVGVVAALGAGAAAAGRSLPSPVALVQPPPPLRQGATRSRASRSFAFRPAERRAGRRRPARRRVGGQRRDFDAQRLAIGTSATSPS